MSSNPSPIKLEGWPRYRPYYAFLLNYKRDFILAVALGMISAAASGFGLPYLLEKILPTIFSDGVRDQREILLAALWLPGIMVIRGLAGFGNVYLTNFCGNKVLEDIRVKVFRHLQSLPLAYFHDQRSGDLLSRLTGDCQAVRNMVVNISNDLIRQPLQLLGALAALVYLAISSEQVGVILVGMSAAPLLFIPIRIVGKILLKKAKVLQRQSGQVTSSLTDSLQAPKEIRAYNLQEREVSRFQSEIADLLLKNMKVVKYTNCLTPINEVLGACAVGGAIAYQGISGMSFDAIVPVLVALNMAYEPIKKMGGIMSKFQKSKASLERLEEILETVDPMPDPEEPLPIPKLLNLRFDAVQFSYDGETPILKDIDLSFKAGEIVALVGSSGAGKSSFAHLLPRFYDPTSGRLNWNGIPFDQFSKHDLREQFSIVAQDPVLFNDTIANNIRLGKADASLEDIQNAATLAHAHSFILEQPDGYETMNGERGSRLSGGQKQRIALARAFLKDAPVLILDEATSALDSESEQAIQQSLEQLVVGKTAFIVAHRFSTIKSATRVLVFDHGDIVGDGSHEELYASHQLYKSLCDHQLQA